MTLGGATGSSMIDNTELTKITAVSLASTSVPTLHLITAGDITQTTAGNVTVPNLALEANSVTLTNTSNDVLQ